MWSTDIQLHKEVIIDNSLNIDILNNDGTHIGIKWYAKKETNLLMEL